MADTRVVPPANMPEVSTMNVGPTPTVAPGNSIPGTAWPSNPGAAKRLDPTDPVNGIGSEGEENVWEGRYSFRNFFVRIGLRVVLVIAWFVLAVYTRGYDHTNLNVPVILFGIFVLVLWFALVIRMTQARLSHHYRLTTRRLFVSTGVIRHERDQMELLRVQDVFTKQQNLTERLLRIGTVVVVPSETHLPTLHILGVEDPMRLMDLIWHQARAEQDQRNVRVETI